MSSSRRRNQDKQAQHGERRFTVRGIRREPVDMGKFSRALLGLARAEAERQAQATARDNKPEVTSTEQAQPKGNANE
jgi:hypothetical protein